MILPQAFLKDVRYYTETKHSSLTGVKTRFTLYFKQWWRLRKRIVLEWTLVDSDGEISTYQETHNIAQLRVQLENYFKEQNAN